MSFEEQVKSNCGRLPHDRFMISQFSQLELVKIDRGLLFIFATWSGAAIGSFRLLCEALALEPVASFQIFVIDADAFNHEAFKKAFGELPQGKGEAFWIKNGEVVLMDRGYTNKSKELINARIKLMSSPKSGTNIG